MHRPGSHRGILRFVLLLVATIAMSAAAGTAVATATGAGPDTAGAGRVDVVGAVHQQVGHLPALETHLAARTTKALPLASLLALALGLGLTLGFRPGRPARVLAVEPGPNRRLRHAASAPRRGPPHPSHP